MHVFDIIRRLLAKGGREGNIAEGEKNLLEKCYVQNESVKENLSDLVSFSVYEISFETSIVSYSVSYESFLQLSLISEKNAEFIIYCLRLGLERKWQSTY